MNNKQNKDLSPEQNQILYNEGTEPPGSSLLNKEKGKEIIIAQVVEQNYLALP